MPTKSKAHKYLEKVGPPQAKRNPPLPEPGQLPLQDPGQLPGQFPGPGQPALGWLEHFYLGYNDLYEAVRRLEKMVHFGQNTNQVGGAVIASPPQPGPGGPPDKAGTPPPPGFPP
jgi:hypothetical protein